MPAVADRVLCSTEDKSVEKISDAETGAPPPPLLIDSAASPAIASDDAVSPSSSPGGGADSGVDSSSGNRSPNDAHHRQSPAEPSVTSSEQTMNPDAEHAHNADCGDAGFNVKILPPTGTGEPFELQVSSMEMVQEIHQVLMDREDTCHRTCFSLMLDGRALDNFSELKTVENLRDGSVLKIVEDLYTVREARIHLRHVRDLIKSLDSADMFNAVDCGSPSFLNTITCGNPAEKRKLKLDTANADCLPPDYCLPNSKDVSLSHLIAPIEPNQSQLQCLKILSPSGWNPPPGNRKLHGDLMYIYVLTMEDKRYHITSCARGFYVNESTEEVFNPKAASPKFIYHSLVDLLCQLSATFRKNFPLLQKKRCQRHPFERVATPYQVFPWLAPTFGHTSDFIRAEDAFAAKLGYEEHIPGQTREWNEELQTTRELPHKTLTKRLLRERAIFKVHSDFVAAATRGAMAVVDGQVMAINPGDEAKMQMYIWNNIFFSLGYDVKEHYKEFGGDEAAFVAPNNDLQGVKAYFNLDPEGLYVLGTVVIDYRGHRVTAQSIIPGILERDQEQSVVYGSIDFGKTIVVSEKYQELLKKPAQQLKIVPHKVKSVNGEVITLHSSVESKGIIGNDQRHYVLDLLRTFPPDVNYLAEAEVNEMSKKLGYPRNHLHKFSCLRQELIEAFIESRYVAFIKIAAAELHKLKAKETEDVITNGDSQKDQEMPHLVDDDSETEAKELVEKLRDKTADETPTSDDSTKDVVRKAALAVGSLSETEFDIRFNPDCYSPTVVSAEDEATIEKQKSMIRDAAEFLLILQIPSFINDCHDHTFIPIDGAGLSEALHNRGINIRYLGRVTTMIDDSPPLEYLRMLCCSELLCRAAKHLFRRFMVGLDRRCVATTAIAHFLNCFLIANTACLHQAPLVADDAQTRLTARTATGGGLSRNRKKKLAAAAINTNNMNMNGPTTAVDTFEKNDTLDWVAMSSKSLWMEICSEMNSYFAYATNSESIEAFLEQYNISKVSVLRRFCTIVGVQIFCRDYGFDSSPSNLKQRQCFTEDDIVNVFPIVKHVNPRATDAYAFYTSGQQKIQQGQLRLGYELVSDALNSLNNVYGAIHAELPQCMRLLARLAYILGDHQEALGQQHKAVLISERCNGLDHVNTIQEYTHLALYCFANLQVSTALKLLYRARYLLLLANGETHPHMALLDSNIGLILHAVSEYDLSLKFLENALRLSIRYFGQRSLKTASAYHLMARTQSCRGDFRSALQHEKETFSVYKKLLGEEHEKTRESSECLKHLTQQAVTFQKRMNEITRSSGSVSQLLPLQIQQPSFASVLEMLNVVNGIVFIQISPKEVELLRQEMDKNEKQANPVIEEVPSGEMLTLD